ncbi:HAD superfamily hydrolase (TIGR01484 family) [Mycoplasmoides fastidiosum]|uniref:HAD superfamily hydrolase (TIGR01484 family) n=1 Tax=Mycoplasmoides fastidiosum TaxID=92758 RepID=A0ABU0LYK1_9BACT|nr:HAD family hydrolase [Mycoplasmoides fastidiosum]MDQ0513786.1 HAD superfamily hydrolase (TIGR01484 family) [Mycoplasmoides fastidiosum]UUD37796.1 Cof-type HAD-IIB family hydrolase [Mycoplasmoides fastidiosum]
MNNLPKIIFCDLDGTLLDNEQKMPHPHLFNYLKIMKENKIVFIITTGRYLDEAMKIFNILGSDSELMPYLITSNGSQIYDTKNQKFLLNAHFSETTSQKFFQHSQELLKQFNFCSLLVFRSTENGGAVKATPIIKNVISSLQHADSEDIASEEKSHVFINIDKKKQTLPHIVFENSINYTESDYLTADNFQNLSKMVVLSFLDNSEELQTFIQNKYKFSDSDITFSSGHSFEISVFPYNKGHSAKTLCELMKINISDAMVLGDSGNDISMLTSGAFSCSPDWANPIVQEAATKIYSGVASEWVLAAFADRFMTK